MNILFKNISLSFIISLIILHSGHTHTMMAQACNHGKTKLKKFNHAFSLDWRKISDSSTKGKLLAHACYCVGAGAVAGSVGASIGKVAGIPLTIPIAIPYALSKTKRNPIDDASTVASTVGGLGGSFCAGGPLGVLGYSACLYAYKMRNEHDAQQVSRAIKSA